MTTKEEIAKLKAELKKEAESEKLEEELSRLKKKKFARSKTGKTLMVLGKLLK